MSQRRSAREVVAQLPSLAPLVILWVIAAVGLVAVGLQQRVNVDQLFLDRTYVANVPWYTGMLSDLGVLVWTAAVVAALGGAWVASQTGRPSAARFLVAGATATAVLLVDDLLRLHSSVLPQTGMSKLTAQLLIVAPAAIWLTAYIDDIKRTRWLVLAAGLAGLGASLAIDTVIHGTSDVAILAEDGAKLLGILAWAQYLTLTTIDITRSTIRAAMGRDLDWPAPEELGPDAALGPQPTREQIPASTG
jgi:hypothetical protein